MSKVKIYVDVEGLMEAAKDGTEAEMLRVIISEAQRAQAEAGLFKVTGRTFKITTTSKRG